MCLVSPHPPRIPFLFTFSPAFLPSLPTCSCPLNPISIILLQTFRHPFPSIKTRRFLASRKINSHTRFLASNINTPFPSIQKNLNSLQAIDLFELRMEHLGNCRGLQGLLGNFRGLQDLQGLQGPSGTFRA